MTGSPISAMTTFENSESDADIQKKESMNISLFYESMCYANAVKEHRNEKLGLVVKRSSPWDAIYISGIKENSKFADSKLKVGMVILTINGAKCPKTVKEIQQVLKECEGNLTIMAATVSSDIDITATPSSTPNSPVRPQKEHEEVHTSVLEGDDGPELIDDAEHPFHGSCTSLPYEPSQIALSPGPSPMRLEERKVTASTTGISPVRVSAIDFAGTINLTPQSDDSASNVAEIPEDLSALEVPTMAARNNGGQNTNKQEELDKAAKRDATKSARISRLPQTPVIPGAYHMKTRPSTAKQAHSVSPLPRQTNPNVTNQSASAPAIGGLPAKASVVPPSTLSPSIPSRGRLSVASANRIPTPNLHTEQEHDASIARPGAQHVPGMRASAPAMGYAPSPSSQSSSKPGYIPASAASAPAAAPRASSIQHGEQMVQQRPGLGVDVGVGVMMSSTTSVISSVSGDTYGVAETNHLQNVEEDCVVDENNSADFSVPVSSDDSDQNGLVIAAEVQEHPEELAVRIRQQILEQTARADVVMVEHGGGAERDETLRQEELKKLKPKNVREKLFGDGKKAKDVSLDIEVAPDQYIRKRDYLPWTVKQNTTNDLWVASVLTNQQAWEDNNFAEQDRSKVILAGKTEVEAKEAGLAMATPILQSFDDNPICYMCKAKFAVFNRPHNCRNCGVVVCTKCSCLWSSKRFPSTYQTSKSTHSVCLACDWSATQFQMALLNGEHAKAVKLYEAGNVNLRSPYMSTKKKAGEEVLYPIHMAILGGNVDTVRWLLKDRCCPLKNDIKVKGKLKSVPIETSKGRTPLKLAIKQKSHDILKYLVAEQGLSLFDEDLRSFNDFQWVLAHLTNTLQEVPYKSGPIPSAFMDNLDIEAKVELATSASLSVSSPSSSQFEV